MMQQAQIQRPAITIPPTYNEILLKQQKGR